MKHDFSALDDWLEKTWSVKIPKAGQSAPSFTVSVLIPTHRRVPIGLQAFLDQDCVSEVLVLANGDCDIQGENVIHVPWRGHGRTRQDAVERATGDYILFSVDDALPRGNGCVRQLVEGLESGPYEAVTGRQLPWPETAPITQARLAQWTPPGHQTVPWHQVDHVFALYPREMLLKHPLPDVPIAEDLHWSQGRTVGYVPTAPIVHAHPRKAIELFRRTRALHVEHCRIGHPPAVPTLASLLRALPSALKTSAQYGPRELPNQLAELLGQWRGSVAAERRL